MPVLHDVLAHGPGEEQPGPAGEGEKEEKASDAGHDR